MKLTIYRSKLGVLPVFICALVACSGNNDDLNKYIQEIKNRPSKPIEPIPQFAPLPIFRFPENDLRRSPFKPIDRKKVNDQYAPDKNRKKQVLEAYPLDALKFVGTLKEGHTIWALIKQPDNQIIRVKIGDYMGQNYGRILLIKDGEIKLEETVKDSGSWEKKMTTLNLDTGKQE